MKDDILKYINSTKYKIYKKKLQYKCGSSTQNYYFIIRGNEIIDILWEKQIGEISEENISHDNAELVVYKVVDNLGDKYFGFRMNQRVEYILNKEITGDSDFGLFFCKSIEEAKRDNFQDEVINKAELKAKVYIDDLVGGNLRNLQFSKCIPIEMIQNL